jgi:glyoxylase-like metal-dependent hydrolase (beta-lactamase superfamily II)
MKKLQLNVEGEIILKENNIVELQSNLFMLVGDGSGSHSYLIKGNYKNVLVDSGQDKYFHTLQNSLLKLGLKVRDIDIIINTHEHFDHIGANRYFQDYALIAAHRFAAVKIAVKDRYVTMYESGDLNDLPLKIHLWLEDKFRFDIGNYLLEVIHTPGHTSGSICLYEVNRNLLFTGDTVFAKGALSYISESGSIGDYINSIGRLTTMKVKEIYPGHGVISKTPEEDMRKALLNAEKLIEGKSGVEIARESRPS